MGFSKNDGFKYKEHNMFKIKKNAIFELTRVALHFSYNILRK